MVESGKVSRIRRHPKKDPMMISFSSVGGLGASHSVCVCVCVCVRLCVSVCCVVKLVADWRSRVPADHSTDKTNAVCRFDPAWQSVRRTHLQLGPIDSDGQLCCVLCACVC